MQAIGARKPIYVLFGVVAWVGGIATAIVPPIAKIDVSKLPAYARFTSPVIIKCQASAWWLSLVFGTITGLSVFARKYMGEPWAYSALQVMIDDFRNYLFADRLDPVYHHRVTLFQYFGVWHPYCLWRGFRLWLLEPKVKQLGRLRPISFLLDKIVIVPTNPLPGTPSSRVASRRCFKPLLVSVARSGHMTTGRRVAFAASDEHYEGVAGQCWACSRMIIAQNLPALAPGASAAAIEEYAKRTFVNPDYINGRLAAGLPVPASLAGCTMRKKGVLWGVVIIDSTDPNGIKNDSQVEYDLFAKMVGKILERL